MSRDSDRADRALTQTFYFIGLIVVAVIGFSMWVVTRLMQFWGVIS